MDLNNYQNRAAETAIYVGRASVQGVLYNALQIASEAGEIAGKVAKSIMLNEIIPYSYPTYIVDSKELSREVGDLLWHVSQLLADLGIDLEEVAQANLTKLASRKQRGVLKGEGDNR